MKQNVTQEDEELVFGQLCEIFEGHYCSLARNRRKYSDGTSEITYVAYVDFNKGILSNTCSTPREAINDVYNQLARIAN